MVSEGFHLCCSSYQNFTLVNLIEDKLAKAQSPAKNFNFGGFSPALGLALSRDPT